MAAGQDPMFAHFQAFFSPVVDPACPAPAPSVKVSEHEARRLPVPHQELMDCTAAVHMHHQPFGAGGYLQVGGLHGRTRLLSLLHAGASDGMILPLPQSAAWLPKANGCCYVHCTLTLTPLLPSRPAAGLCRWLRRTRWPRCLQRLRLCSSPCPNAAAAALCAHVRPADEWHGVATAPAGSLPRPACGAATNDATTEHARPRPAALWGQGPRSAAWRQGPRARAALTFRPGQPKVVALLSCLPCTLYPVPLYHLIN